MKSRDVADVVAGGLDLAELVDAAVPMETGAEPGQGGEVFVEGASTLRWAKGEAVLVVPYALRFEVEQRVDGVTCLRGTALVEGGRSRPFVCPAEALGNPRAMNGFLANLLGADFRPAGQRLSATLAAWLEASNPARIEASPDFGFDRSGESFMDAVAVLPHGEGRFSAPPESAGDALGLAPSNPSRARAIAARLLDLWPKVLEDPMLVRALLGIVGWGLVAPVLEAQDRAVAPLLGFLNGPSGVGKSTHAGLVQSFFGDFGTRRAAVSFGSTALAIEEEGYWFRGAGLVVGDVKARVLSDGASAQFLGLLQRAGDRGIRRRLNVVGAATTARPSRATWLFEGEDLPTQEGSAVARLLVLPMPATRRQPERVSALEALRPDLPVVTRGLVDFLLATRPWTALGEAWATRVERVAQALQPANNAVRLAKSAASVLTGAELWRPWLVQNDLDLPGTSADLEAWFVELLGSQSQEVDDQGPGELLLNLVRQLFAMKVASLDNRGQGTCVGALHGDVAYLMPDAILSTLAKHLPQGTLRLPPARSIAKELDRIGALAEHDEARLTKKRRLGEKGAPVATWAVHSALLLDDERGTG